MRRGSCPPELWYLGVVGTARPVGLVIPSFVDRLLELNSEEATGVLEVRAEALVTIVYLADGVPVFAEGGSLGDTLGRVLVREQMLTDDEYRKVLEHMTSTVMTSEQVRFGEVAIMLGFLSTDEVNRALRTQVVDKIANCLQWQKPEVVFRPDAGAPDEVSHFACAVEKVVFEGVRRFWGPQRCEEVWQGAAHLYPELAQDARNLTNTLNLSSDQGRFLHLLNGTRDMRRAIEAAPLDVVEAAQLLTTLVLVEALELFTTPREPPSRRPPRLLSFRPSRFPKRQQPSRPPLPALHQLPSLQPPAERERRLRAEQHFQNGRRLVTDRDWSAALEEFEAARRHWPRGDEYHLHAEWARFQELQRPADRLVKRRELRDLAVAALRRDRTIAFAHYVLAELAVLDNDQGAARRAVSLALRFDPTQQDVTNLARRLTQAQGSPEQSPDSDPEDPS